MKIQDMIAKCDESEVFTQNLAENMSEAKVQGANGLVTFRTDPKFVLEMLTGTPKVAVIVWFPTDVFDR